VTSTVLHWWGLQYDKPIAIMFRYQWWAWSLLFYNSSEYGLCITGFHSSVDCHKCTEGIACGHSSLLDNIGLKYILCFWIFKITLQMAMDGWLIINKPACTIVYSYCFLLVHIESNVWSWSAWHSSLTPVLDLVQSAVYHYISTSEVRWASLS
jgi:hypothetical protein